MPLICILVIHGQPNSWAPELFLNLSWVRLIELSPHLHLKHLACMHTYVTLHDSCLLNSSNWMIVALLGLLSLMVTHPDSRETGHSILTSLTERHCRIPQICIGSLLNSDFYSISYRLKSRDPSSPWVPCCLGIGIISIPSLHQPDHLQQKKLGHSLIQKSTNPSIHSKCSISIVTTMMSNYIRE